MCLRLQACPGISPADEYAMKIRSAQIIDKVLKNPQQTVHSVLNAHDAHKADDRLSHPPQTTVRLDAAIETAQLDSIANDGYTGFRHTSAFQGEPFVRFIRDD